MSEDKMKKIFGTLHKNRRWLHRFDGADCKRKGISRYSVKQRRQLQTQLKEELNEFYSSKKLFS